MEVSLPCTETMDGLLIIMPFILSHHGDLPIGRQRRLASDINVSRLAGLGWEFWTDNTSL